MKTSILKKVLFVIMLFVCHSASAHDFEVNGIYYGISIFNKNTAYVTHRGTGYNDYKEYSGSVVIPESVTYNGKSYTVASIGGYAFYGCDELTSVTIPATVNTINQNAFNGCTRLMDIECKATTPPALGDNAFSSYNALLIVPESSESTYKSTIGWKNFNYPVHVGDVVSVSGVTYKVISETEVEVIARTAKYTGDIVIPSEISIDKKYTVTSIGYNAFNGCTGLTSITIPSTVTNIGNSAFYGCTGLLSVTSLNPIPPVCGTDVFGNVDTQNIQLTVPEESVSAYKSADTWKDFKYAVRIGEIVEYDGLTYKVTSNTEVEVVAGTAKYTGDIVIPSEITVYGNKYIVIKIGDNAFYQCTDMTSIKIPNSVTSIGELAFSYCTNLTSVNLPNSVTSLGVSAFNGCSGLMYVIIPNSVTSIEVHVFSHCINLSSIVVECGNTVYDSRDNCNAIIETATNKLNKGCKTTKIPNTVTSIGWAAFCGCTDLANITIPNSITSIDGYAFQYCVDLKSVLIPNSVTSIENGVFSGCTGLTSIEIPNSVTSIGNNAFAYCTGLTSVTSLNPTPPTCGTNVFYVVNTQNIPLTVPSESVSAYKSADTWKDFGSITGIGGGQETNIGDVVEYEGLTYKVISETEVEVIAGESKYTGSIVIPSEISIDKKYTVTSIGVKTFNGCTGLTSITIPSTVTNIGNYAFGGCTGLTSIEIPNSVISIGIYAFDGCTGLTNVKIGNFVTSIGYSAFCGCTDLKAVYITDLEAWCKIGFGSYDANPLYYAKNLYKNNEKVTNLVIPNTITAIKFATFYNCSSLTSVTIPNTVTSIGDSAFQGCFSLTNIEIPNSVTSIGDDVFCDCVGLTSVTIGNSVASIGNSSFYNCTSITSVYITDVEAWCKIDFGYYSNPISGANSLYLNNVKLTNIEIPNTITEIKDYAFVGYDGLASITIPNTVTSIGESAFQGCSGLTNVIIPNSIISIGESAFYYCSGLTSITIGNSVASIGKRVFYDCTGLKSVTSLNPTPPTCETNVFGGVNTQNIPLMVPAESVELYKSADTWKDFGTITGIGGGQETSELNYNIISDTEVEVVAGETKYTEDIVIPSETTLNGKNYIVTRIGERAFSECTGMTSVKIPNSVTSIGYGAFEYCTGLTSIAIPSTVMSIERAAFEGCKGLASITIPKSVTSIGVRVFSNCISLTSIVVESGNTVYDSRNNCNAIIKTSTNTLINACKTTVIPNSVTSIENFAFESCTGLTSITIPNSVTRIGLSAFEYCTSLTSITIGNSVTRIEETAFRGCTGLTNIVIPNSVTSIDYEVFSGCTSLMSVVVEKGNTVYDSRDNCNAIIETATNSLISGCKTTVIPNSITSIGYRAFINCTGLTHVVIPEFVTIIGTQSFSGCTNLTSITIGNSVSIIGYSAFYGCNGLASVTSLNPTPPVCETNAFYNVDTQKVTLSIPSESVSAYKAADTWKNFGTITGIGGGQETNIGDVVEYEGLTYKVISETQVELIARANSYTGDIVIPSEVTIESNKYTVISIGDRAFFYDSGLTSVTIPNSVISIGESAFEHCMGLTSVEIPNSVTSIGKSAFYYCRGLTSITIPNAVTSIGDSAFSGLTSIVVENGNTVYDSRDNCNAIIESATNTLIIGSNSTVIPNTVKTIGYYAFSHCNDLTSVMFPSSITIIGTGAFYACTNLTSVTIPNSVTNIGELSFFSCKSLTSILIPNSVTNIGPDPFGRCSDLISIVVESGNTVYDSRDNCNAIIETSTNTLISGCKTTVIPNSVTSISNYAFNQCTGLTSITIPNSVTSIGTWAFYGCTGLTSVTSLNPTPPACDADVFLNVNTQNITLTVPSESVSAYKAADTWKNFGTIVGIEGAELPTEPTLEELWVHDMASSGNAVRNAVCIGDQIAVTDISFSGGSDKVLFYNAMGKMNKSYDVGAYIKEQLIGSDGGDGSLTSYGLGRGIAVDEVGNIVVNLGFSHATSSTNFVAIAPDNMMKHIVCEVPLPATAARADFIDVEGDIFNNAYIALAINSMSQIAVYNIKNGVQDVNNSYTVEDADLSNMFTNETKVIFPTKNIEGNAEYASKFYVYDRHYKNGIRYSDGYHSLVAMNANIFSIGNATCTGATAFEVNGTTYIVMPTSNSSGMRANAFKIINVKTGEVVVTSQGAAGYTDKTVYTQDYSAWVNEDGTVNIAQLVQGTYLAMYKFYPGKDTSISIGSNMNMSGAEETLIDDEDEPIEYYNLNGVRVQNPGKGVYIKHQGGRATKVML